MKFPRTDGGLKLKYFNISLPNMIPNFTESYTLASDGPEPEPETRPDAIISSSEGKGENIGPQRKQPGDNYCVSCSALLPSIVFVLVPIVIFCTKFLSQNLGLFKIHSSIKRKVAK